jgi:hypothetical protein
MKSLLKEEGRMQPDEEDRFERNRITDGEAIEILEHGV